VFALGLAVVALVFFAAGVRRDPRSFGNAVFLALALAMFALGIAGLFAKLSVPASIAVLLSGYVVFLFVSYVGYGFRYGRVAKVRVADFVVVLGSGLSGGRRVPPLLASRLDRGREVYETLLARGTPAPIMIVSGGKGGDERVSEAAAMAGYLTKRGFPADRLVREDQSRTTEENIRFSKAIMDRTVPGSRCVIVTSNFHVYRAAIIARREGVDGQVTAAPAPGEPWATAVAIVREFAAVVLTYWLVNVAVCALIVALPLAYAAALRLL
jgi:uncharacterized SAM-binding protein YcdF (DUF218 family)